MKVTNSDMPPRAKRHTRPYVWITWVGHMAFPWALCKK